ncbi:MAG: hypothetical protein ACE37H_11990 [Phycisphaeraceae bacterium]
MMHVKVLPDPPRATRMPQDDTIVSIERQALRVAQRYSERSVQEGERDDVAAGIELEIMLVLGHIDRIRQSHAKTMHRLLELEAQTNTKRMNLRPWGYLSGSENTPAHHRLDDRVFKLDMERLRLTSTLDDKLRPQHDRLQQLLIKHAVLNL